MPELPTNIDKQTIDRGYWIATHRISIKKWTARALYACIGIFYLIFFTQFGIYMFQYSELDRLMATAARPTYNWEQIHSAHAPLPIETSTPIVLPLGDNRYDLVVEAYNPNTRWAISTLKYSFSADTKVLHSDTSFILPGEHKFFSALGYHSDDTISAVTFTMDSTEWRTVTHPTNLSWIYTEEPKFFDRQIISENGKETVLPARIEWKVKNGSTYNIRDVTWQIGLYSGQNLVGISQLDSELFTFLQERSFEQRIYSPLQSVDRVVLYPIVNVFDPNFTYVEAKH